MAVLSVIILLLTSFGGWEAAEALPIAPALLGKRASSTVPVEPVRWRYHYRYRHRYDNDDDGDSPNVFWKRSNESSGNGSLVNPLMPTTPAEPRRRGRWIDPPPPQ